MKWLIAILILAVILISGCTQTINSIGTQVGVGITSIEDVIKNPENYSMKNVTIKGELWGEFPSNYNIMSCQKSSMEEVLRDCTRWYLVDAQGYRISVVKNPDLINNRVFEVGFKTAEPPDYPAGTYVVKGQIRYATTLNTNQKEIDIYPYEITLV